MSARRIACGLLLLSALPLGFACRPVIMAKASTPTPTLYAKLSEGTVRIDVFEVLDKRCSSLQKHRDYCVENLYKSMGEGLTNTLGKFMKPGGDDAAFVADFRLLDFKQLQSQRDPNAVLLTMRWKFSLKRVADGQTVIDLDETTPAPQEVVRADLATPTVMQIINTIFERIGAELGKQDLSGQPPPPPPPPEPEEPPTPAQVCVPNATQECVGPGACKGGQSCLPDGSGFTECDCGKKKKKTGGSAPAPAPASQPAPSGELPP